MTEHVGSRLSAQELELFLAAPLTARLACLDNDDHPYIVPLWHEWDGERFWLIASERAKWVEYLHARPQVALSIDDPETNRVLVRGLARLVEDPTLDGAWVPIARQMVHRYLGEAAYPGYLAATAGMKRWLIAIEVDSIVTWRGPSRAD